MQQRGGEHKVGCFTSLLIWDSFQGEVAAEQPLNGGETSISIKWERVL